MICQRVLYQDGDLQLFESEGEHYLRVGERTYGLKCSAYEPCLYLLEEDIISIVIHNAITVREIFHVAESNGSSLMITGNRYDINGICRLLRKALSLSVKSMDMSYLEGCCFLDYLEERGAVSENSAVTLTGSAIDNPRMLNPFLHSKKLFKTDDGRYYIPKSLVKPRYYLCKRFFPKLPVERNWFGELIREVVSVDGALFPKEEQTILTEEQAVTIEIEDGDQVLRVLCVPGEKGKPNISGIAAQTVEGFKFCGFDLVDSWVSAILNCGSFTDGDYYSKAFDYRELNEFGLIPDYQSAVRISRKLREEYPEEEHVYCDIYAIWRRI